MRLLDREHHRGASGSLLFGWSSSHSSRGLHDMTRGMRFMPVLPFAAIRQYSSLNITLLMVMVKSSPGRRAASNRTYIIARSRLLVVAFMMVVNSSWVSRLSGVTRESLFFTVKFI